MATLSKELKLLLKQQLAGTPDEPIDEAPAYDTALNGPGIEGRLRAALGIHIDPTH